MKLEFEMFSHLCEMARFRINNVDAVWGDFGSKKDREPGIAEEYGCGCMKFIRQKPSKMVLEKYSITKEEYGEVCCALEESLSFGSCGLCV